jgi:EmrB/QacA subfamily drug resistance transporter
VAASATGVASQRWLLAAVAGGVFVAADDQTSIVAVLPPIINDLGITVDDFYRSSWVINGYLLGYIVALPVLGRVADIYGRRRIFAAALAVFMAGSAAVALAPTFETLVVARAVQAIGGGGVVPVALAIVVDELPPARRVFGLGAIAAASEAGALLGPLWGGAIADWVDWRAVFWVNLPMALVPLLMVWRRGESSRRGEPIDWRGAAVLTLTLATLVVTLVDDPNGRRPLAATFAMLALVAVGGVIFVARERAAEAPMIRLAMFRERAIAAANAASVLLGVGLIGVLITVPLFVNLVLADDPIDGGLTLLRLTAAVPVGALVGGWLASRAGLRATAALGLVLAAVGALGLLSWDVELGEVARSLPLVIGGFGFGLVIAPLGAAVLLDVGEEERATASGWLTLSRVTGMLVGTSLLTSTGLGRFYGRAGDIAFDSPEFNDLVRAAQVETFHEVFVAIAIILAAAAVAAMLLPGRMRIDGGAPDPWWTVS